MHFWGPNLFWHGCYEFQILGPQVLDPKWNALLFAHPLTFVDKIKYPLLKAMQQTYGIELNSAFNQSFRQESAVSM